MRERGRAFYAPRPPCTRSLYPYLPISPTSMRVRTGAPDP
jgi:hypothetical protein